MEYREGTDTLGVVRIPKNAHYGPQTQRSLLNFNICKLKDLMPIEIIKSLVLLKLCASRINLKSSLITKPIQELIEFACLEILDDKHTKEFPLVIWQTGSGTQTNMNVNEVIASISNVKSGKPIGSFSPVHPNDHVNCAQSSNDIIPSAINVACVIRIIEYYLPALKYLKKKLILKKLEFNTVVKIGRTHLQDAVPLTFGQELSGYIDQIEQNLNYIEAHIPHVCKLAIGGTAVGTGLNSVSGYDVNVCDELNEFIKERWKLNKSFFDYPLDEESEVSLYDYENIVNFSPASNKFAALSGHDALCVLSGLLQNSACALLRLASDFTLLSSGPRCGFSEILLPANEPGSSIMPGKVNPTQCESMSMVCIQVMGNHQTVAIGASRGVLELNVYKPLIAANILHSISLLSDSSISFAKNCVQGMKVNFEKMQQYVESSLMLVTVLNPIIGYEKSAILAKWAQVNNKTLREAVEAHDFIEIEEFDRVVNPYQMTSNQNN